MKMAANYLALFSIGCSLSTALELNLVQTMSGDF
jgi:hypothetical protein